MNNEVWKDIKGYEELYQVSNLGRIKRKKHKRYDRNQMMNEKIIKPAINRFGYLRITLCKNSKHKCYSVHRLVIENFVGESELQVDHKDGNKLNNRLDNLEYVTSKENTNRAWKNGQSKPNNNRKVLQYDKNGNFIKEWSNISLILKKMNKSQSNGNINNCCSGRTKNAYGYIWKYGEKW